jgi:hypothetical protein
VLGASGTWEPCAIPDCAHEAVERLRLLVDGCEALLPVCRCHGDWLGAYVEEDADVRLLDRPAEAPGDPIGEDRLNDQA